MNWTRHYVSPTWPLAASVLVIGLSLAFQVASLSAHQIDEYVGVTLVEVQRNRIRAFLSLTPGSEIAAGVIAAIDTNRDGVFSDQEVDVYARAMSDGVTMALDAARLPTRLIATTVPAPEDLYSGQAIIRLTLESTLPPQQPGRHSLEVSNTNQALTVLLANALVPPDPRVRILRQSRDWYQRRLEITYDVTPRSLTPWIALSAIVVLLGGALTIRRYRRRAPAVTTDRST